MRASAARRSSDTPDDHVERDKTGADVAVLCLTSAPPFEQQPMDREARPAPCHERNQIPGLLRLTPGGFRSEFGRKREVVSGFWTPVSANLLLP